MRIVIAVSTLAAALFVGCTTHVGTSAFEPTVTGAYVPSEVEYLAKIDTVDTEFSLPADVSDVAWERAHSFVENYAAIATHRQTDTLMDTWQPDPDSRRCGYMVTRARAGDEYVFHVDCIAPNNARMAMVERNARILAHYMLTGELPPTRRLVAR